MIEHDDELERALRSLPREVAPPKEVKTALEGINRRSRHRQRLRRTVRGAWRVGLAASFVVAAFAAGRMSAPVGGPAPDAGREYAFLLYGGGSGGDDRAAEYGAWVGDLIRRGVRVSGERLADQAWIAGEPRPADTTVRGFFIVRAADGAAAVELARSHPHARFGTIEVRPIDTP